MTLEQKIKATEELTENRFKFLENGNTPQEIEEEFGHSSYDGIYIFGDWNENTLSINITAKDAKISYTESTGEPHNWLSLKLSNELYKIWGGE